MLRLKLKNQILIPERHDAPFCTNTPPNEFKLSNIECLRQIQIVAVIHFFVHRESNGSMKLQLLARCHKNESNIRCVN